MAKPLMPVEEIHDRALRFLDEEGPAEFTTRKLAAALGISTRTLYQQTGSRDALIRALVARYFSSLRLEFEKLDDWKTTAWQWCLTLYEALRAHPYLTELMTVDDREAVMSFVDELLVETIGEGYPADAAEQVVRSLVNLTINHAITEVRGLRDPRISRDPDPLGADGLENLRLSVRWILIGFQTDLRG